MTTQTQVLPKPKVYENGFIHWLTSTNHKDIGILYMVTASFFFVVGGIEALLIRIQLAQPNGTVLSPQAYNEVFTMHGTTMIFLFAMPMLVGVGNYMVPLLIGARDMAFPRLNGLSYWLFLAGGLLMYSSFVLGGAPDAGWFSYAPLTTLQFSPTHGMDFWAIGIIWTGIASTMGAVNFIVTILNMRAPGMSFFRMPVFVWMMLVTVFLMIFALPSLTADAILLFFERNFGAPFFLAPQGGDPLLWQHLFWFFGHPEVYILIVPAFGIISEVVPVFSHKPLFGYGAIVYSGIAIGFLSFTVWAHHMFAVGLSPIADAVFSADSMIIAVPTSIKIFNWIGTMWKGKIQLKTAMLFAIGFIAMFIIGGLSGISLAVVPADFQFEDTYYVVAHLHYVLFGGTLLAVFAGFYYWFPKVTGKFLSETLGKIHFWVILVGFNMTFFPMHIVGLMGMPRRIYTYAGGSGWDLWNLVETIGAFVILTGLLVFLWNIIKSLRSGAEAGGDPWDGQTLEWTISSPAPRENYAEIPVVHGRRPAWDLKRAAAKAQNDPAPKPRNPSHPHEELDEAMEHSFNPSIIALGFFVLAFGLIFHFWWLAAVGVVIVFIGIARWAYEPRG